MDLIEFNGVFS